MRNKTGKVGGPGIHLSRDFHRSSECRAVVSATLSVPLFGSEILHRQPQSF